MTYIAELEFPSEDDECNEIIYTIGVISYHYQPPCSNADNDMDYYGYEEIEWDLIDEKGNVINDLSDEMKEIIEQQISEHFEKEANEDI